MNNKPHGFGILIPSKSLIRIGYFYDGKKEGCFTSIGLMNDKYDRI